MSKPPVNQKVTKPLQGSTEFRVITLGLQEVVRQGLDAGKGVNKIAKEINETILVDSNIKISGMAILRWSKEHYNDEQRHSSSTAVNLYNTYVNMLNSIDKQIDIQEAIIDDLSKESSKSIEDIVAFSRTLNSTTTTLEKMLARKQVLLQTIGAIQDKVYGYMAASEVVQITLETVKGKSLELYTEIMTELRKNDEYMLLFRKIRPQK